MKTPALAHRRILVIDDNQSIHDDFRKILIAPDQSSKDLDQVEASLFGDPAAAPQLPGFELDSAYQGQEGLERIEKSLRESRPYAMAFVDVRMPPGWDGVETVGRIWQTYPDLQVVICTAYSDYSWEEMLQKLGYSDRLVILKKPFDNIEVLQLAISLTEKWRLSQQEKSRRDDLERMVADRTRALQVSNSELASANREWQLATERANEMAEAARLAAQAKAEFLANMSHEIRTPMNGVIGMTNLLLKTGLNSSQRDYADTIRVSAHSLLTIINDILDFSKIEAGKLALELIDFDLRDVVEGTLELLAERAHAKGVELASTIQLDVTTAVRGDPGRVRQILLNLVGNAIKFTERGEVIVRVSRPGDIESEANVRIDIQDTGIGIPPEARGRLFEAFTQADGSTTRKFGGTGLGLAISKQLVGRMGGQIGFESQPGVGSDFWFTLRLEEQSASNQAAGLFHAALVDLRALVVDDNAASRQILRHQIYAWKIRKSSAAGGSEALQMMRRAAAEARAYDFALLDLEMPEMDGLTLARAIKADPAIARTRLIVLSSMGRQLDVADLQSAGIDACLIKPVRQRRLFDCLVSVMTKPQVETESRASEAKPSSARPANPLQHRGANVRILLAEDNPINQKVALWQLQELGYTADVAANGREVLKALEAKAYDLIFMDCQMPELDGYEATRQIRSRYPKGAVQPRIIAMTAHAMAGDREKCLAAGMDDYISKPVQESDLLAALNRWGKNGACDGRAALPPSRSSVDVAAQQHHPTGDGFMNRYVFSVGSTGDSPVPSGDPPDGMAVDLEGKLAPRLAGERASVSLGESPREAGESPALPTLNRYMNPSHDSEVVEASHEPERRSPIQRDDATWPKCARSETGAPSGQSAMTASPVDLERLRKVTFGVDAALTELVEMYLQQAEETLRNLETAIQNKSAEMVEQLAHRLAGCSSTCGMVALVPALRALEKLGGERRLDSASQLCSEAKARLREINAFLIQHTGSLNKSVLSDGEIQSSAPWSDSTAVCGARAAPVEGSSLSSVTKAPDPFQAKLAVVRSVSPHPHPLPEGEGTSSAALEQVLACQTGGRATMGSPSPQERGPG